MAKFDLSNPNPGRWIPLGWEDVEIKARAFTVADGLEALKRNAEGDEREEAIEVLDQKIIDWRNLEDSDGNSIPCTSDNKRVFFLNGPPEIFRAGVDAIKAMAERAADTVKNSESSQTG